MAKYPSITVNQWSVVWKHAALIARKRAKLHAQPQLNYVLADDLQTALDKMASLDDKAFLSRPKIPNVAWDDVGGHLHAKVIMHDICIALHLVGF